jgi:hypothetical protein
MNTQAIWFSKICKIIEKQNENRIPFVEVTVELKHNQGTNPKSWRFDFGGLFLVLFWANKKVQTLN